MNKTLGLLRKIGVALVGFPLLIIGLILIPLPGPGILVVLLGLIILAMEFEWAKSHKQRIHRHYKKLIAKTRKNT